MAFLSDAQTLVSLEDTLKKPAGTLQSYWSRINTESHAWAYAHVVNVLLGKGFTIAQIADWDSGAHYERDLTLWRALTRGGGLEGYDDKFVKTFDRREELKALVALEIDGVFTAPAGTAGQVSTGPLDTTTDVFVWPDPDDPNLGSVTRW